MPRAGLAPDVHGAGHMIAARRSAHVQNRRSGHRDGQRQGESGGRASGIAAKRRPRIAPEPPASAAENGKPRAELATAAAVADAHAVHLRYVSDSSAGIRRERAGRGFRFVGVHGRRVRDAETLARIHGLVIPPAWTDVWICPIANGHLQATGHNAQGPQAVPLSSAVAGSAR